MTTEKGPDTPSADHEAMAPYWRMVETILEGAEAMRRAGSTGGENPYLPKFPNEADEDYRYRKANAKFTNIYADIVSNLASKPFAKEVTLDEDAPDRIKALAEDIDGRGNNLHVFAANLFFGGVNNAFDWVLVEFTKTRPNPSGRPLSQAEERAQGLRPYWLHIPASRMLAAYTATIDGKEAFVHCRFREDATVRDGYVEVARERVRELNREPIVGADGAVTGYGPATYTLWEKQKGNDGKDTWVAIDSGAITLGVIPLVPFITGRRKGGSWRFVPPLQDAAYLQIEHFQQETALKHIKELTAFPMLSANGVAPRQEGGKIVPVPVGPQAVLYAPPYGEGGQHGEWIFIEPTAESLKFLAADVENTEKQLREIGRQPLTATAGITVVTAALASQKASSAVQAWAWALKDALEQALRYTAMWLKEPVEPEVRVFTDFAIEAADDKGPTMIMEMRKNGDLSRRTTWDEAQRRGILSGDFDADDEEQALQDELPDADDDIEITGAVTPPAEV